MIETKNKPYYDDFEIAKGFLKVLFKPGITIQTRELNQLQSIIQNQLGSLADTIFKDGSVVKDGQMIFRNDVNYIKVFPSYNSQNFIYSNFAGRRIYGTTTQLVARVSNGTNVQNSLFGVLYLDYLNSGLNDTKTFEEEEILQLINEIYVSNIVGTFEIGETITGATSGATAKFILNENNKLSIVFLTSTTFTANEIILGATSGANCVYNSGESTIQRLQVENSTNVVYPIGFGSSVNISEGVYYINGYFVNVPAQSLIIEPFSASVNARVGLIKEVQYIDSNADSTLLDNASGEPNSNAPGADRLTLNLVLSSYPLYTDVSEQFVEIMRIENSNIVFNTSSNSQWSNIIDLLAKRTYDESGNYVVKPFIVNIQEFLNDGTNNGVYNEEYYGFNSAIEAQNAAISIFGDTVPGTSHLYNLKYYPLTTHANYLQACEDRVALGINPGVAYVLGYEVNLPSLIYVPMLKARDTGLDINDIVNIKYGNYCRITGITSLPDITNLGVVNLNTQTTYDETPANLIGTARVKAIYYESGTIGSSTAIYRLYLNDISVNTGYSFTASVKTLGNLSIDGFKCSAVLDSYGAFNLYDLDKNILVYSLPRDAVQSLSNTSYNYMYETTGTTNSSGHVVISSPSNSIFTSTTGSDYMVTMLSGPELGKLVDCSGLVTLGGSPVGTLLTITLTSTYASTNFKIIAPVFRTIPNLKSKTLIPSAQYSVTTPTALISIPHYDGYKLRNIYMSADLSTAATVSDTDVTSNYIFDGGQRDNYYGLASVSKRSGIADPTGQLLIIFDYFLHGTGDYFAAESYTNALDYEDIPVYTSENGTPYNLANCLDIRPHINENGVGFNNLTNPNIIENNSNVITNLQFYLPRIDALEVDYAGNFKIKKGTSSQIPQPPVPDDNAMLLYYFNMPAYTANLGDIVKVYKENKRYTMQDIGLLDNRINQIENYILLTQNEYDVTNTSIFGDDNTERYKVGYIADNFTDLSYGDITNSAFKCSVDITNNQLRPSFKLNTISLIKNTSVPSQVIEMNGKYMLPMTNVNAINQVVGTDLYRMNSNGLVSWNGNLLITPSVNNVYNNIDQRNENFTGDNEYLNNINGVLVNSDNSYEYGNWFLNWLGV